MIMKKLLCLCMALVLALGCVALAEEDLEAQLNAANAKIAELQALVDAYYPYYAAKLAATYGEDGVIWLDDILAEYEAVAAQYANMGLDLAAYGMEEFVKKDLLDSAVEQTVVLAKAKELGLDQFDAETTAAFEAAAQESLQLYLDSYINYYYPEAEVTDELIAEANQYMDMSGMGLEALIKSEKDSATFEAVHTYVTKDVEVTEEDIQASYQALIEENKANYAENDYNYNNDRSNGTTMAWQPEGYRSVKHVLIKFDDEQNARYTELQSQLSALNAEKEAIDNPLESTEGEEAVEPRAIEEINSDIAACATEIEALYSQLMPEAEEVIEAFNAGASFEDLIEKYNDDPGMKNEPTASMGYAVAANSTTWDPAFTQGAMSIENKGEISAPVCGSYGVHILYYFEDIPAGEVALEEIRDEIAAMASDAKIESTYADTVAAWIDEMNVTYYYENLGVTA